MYGSRKLRAHRRERRTVRGQRRQRSRASFTSPSRGHLPIQLRKQDLSDRRASRSKSISMNRAAPPSSTQSGLLPITGAALRDEHFRPAFSQPRRDPALRHAGIAFHDAMGPAGARRREQHPRPAFDGTHRKLTRSPGEQAGGSGSRHPHHERVFILVRFAQMDWGRKKTAHAQTSDPAHPPHRPAGGARSGLGSGQKQQDLRRIRHQTKKHLTPQPGDPTHLLTLSRSADRRK